MQATRHSRLRVVYICPHERILQLAAVRSNVLHRSGTNRSRNTRKILDTPETAYCRFAHKRVPRHTCFCDDQCIIKRNFLEPETHDDTLVSIVCSKDIASLSERIPRELLLARKRNRCRNILLTLAVDDIARHSTNLEGSEGSKRNGFAYNHGRFMSCA